MIRPCVVGGDFDGPVLDVAHSLMIGGVRVVLRRCRGLGRYLWRRERPRDGGGDAGGIGSGLTWVAAARETRATGGSGRMVSGLAGTAAWYEYAPLYCSGP